MCDVFVKTIVAEDYYNDIFMLKQAGVLFKVANAGNDAKDAADYITVCNNDYAIAAIIDSLDQKQCHF